MEISNNKYVSTAITIGLGLYVALLGPNLPKFVKDLFSNTLFRILILFLVVVRGNKDPQMAIMIAVAFVLTLDYIYVRDVKEKFAETSGTTPAVSGGTTPAVSGGTTPAVSGGSTPSASSTPSAGGSTPSASGGSTSYDGSR